jgi:hypothetical protein
MLGEKGGKDWGINEVAGMKQSGRQHRYALKKLRTWGS